MTKISLRGMLMVAVSAAALTACTSETTETNLTTALSAANATIATQTSDLATANATIATRNATIADKNTEIAAKQAIIDARDATIVAKNAEIATKNGLIAAAGGDVSDLEDEVAALELEVAGLESDIADLESDIADLESDIDDLEAEVAGLETEKADLQSQVTNYNKNAFNANRGNTSYTDGGYQRNVGVGATQPEKDAVAARQADLATKSSAVTAAQTAFDDAQNATSDAMDAKTLAQSIDPTPYDGQPLSAYVAGDAADAAIYADVMGLDITNTADLDVLVHLNNYLNVGIVGLTDDYVAAVGVEQAALTALNTAISDVIAAQANLLTAQNALTAAGLAQKGTVTAVGAAETTLAGAKDIRDQKQTEAGTASGAQSSAQASYDSAAAFVVDPAYESQTLATYIAGDQQAASAYASIMGLDVANSADQGTLVSSADLATEVGNLLTALNNAITAKIAADAALTSAQTGVTTAEAALDTAIANYRSDRRPQQSSTMTLYQADGSAVGASGAMVYKQGLDDTLLHGQGLVEAGRLTALFLLDANGDPTNVLVFEASMVGETVNSPFSLPPGAATFESTSMVAGFAQLEGAENGINTYTLDGDTDAGSLTINFNTKTGTLVVDGLVNGANQDFSVNANLTFDPINGTFSATAVNQAYTSDTTGLAEVATGNIVGELSAVADAFTAYIDTTDKTGINDVNVKIMTRIVGTGAVTLAP